MFEWPKGPVPNTPETTTNEDGSVSTAWSFSLDGDSLRPVRDEVVEAIDTALGAHGEVLHAIDPSRLQRFDAGGPAVWSVGMVRVEPEQGRPYWLFVTYGFSGVLTPVPYREPYAHEYSIAVPADGDSPPGWAGALLRHLARYVLNSGAELHVGDNMPCHHAITQIAFAPEHHASIPSTALDSVVVATDPLVPTVETPHGPVEVRRIVGIHPDELGLIELWNCSAFLTEWSAADPLLLTDPIRSSLLEGAFGERCRSRADAEGSSIGSLYVEAGWRATEDGGAELGFPGGHQAERILKMLRARLAFGRPLVLHGPPQVGPIAFLPGDTFELAIEEGALLIIGTLDLPQIQEIVSYIQPDGPGAMLRIA